jgi:Gpi18-like mannosyltransferase
MIHLKSQKMGLSWVKINHDWLLVLLSLLVQLPLAVFLGHYYDERVFMTTGYLVSSGLDPYQQYQIVGVFSHPLLQGIIPRFGYPPTGALMLGLTFDLSYQIVPNLLFYNFAIKIPVLAANIFLAFLVREIMLGLNASKKKAQFAFLFLLFNPFTLLTTAAWGQFDTVVALLCVASLYLLVNGRTGWSAVTLGLAFCVKPIVLPLLCLPLFFGKPKWHGNLKYLSILTVTIFTFYILPFLVFGWQLLFTPNELNAHFTAAGGMTPFGIVEVINDTLVLPSALEFLGFLWVPALLIGYYRIYRNPPSSQTGLIQNAIGLVLIFFLTRSWLSEPNINLLLPLMLIALGTAKVNFRNFHFVWIIPFFFLFLNYSVPSLFFMPYPTVISDLAVLDAQIRTWRLTGKLAIITLWQVFAWMFLFKILFRKTSKNIITDKHNSHGIDSEASRELF